MLVQVGRPVVEHWVGRPMVEHRVAKSVVLGMISWQTRVLSSKKEVTQSVLSSLFQPIAMEVPQTMRLGRLVRA